MRVRPAWRCSSLNQAILSLLAAGLLWPAGAGERPALYPHTAGQIRAEVARLAATPVRVGDRELAALSSTEPADAAEQQAQALRELMIYRYLCGLPYADLQLDPHYTQMAQTAAELLEELGQISHTPRNPGWPKERYSVAKQGAAEGNLYYHSREARLASALRMYMGDTDADNRVRLGHRRWCLSPVLQKTGFGLCKRMSVMYVFDRSRVPPPEYSFVAYPANGLMPVEYFDPSSAWCVLLNPERFQEPRGRKVKVSVTPAEVTAEGQVRKTGRALALEDVHVNTDGCGIRYAVIFRPKDLEIAPGTRVWVEVTGLERQDDEQPAAVRYLVDFFKLKE